MRVRNLIKQGEYASAGQAVTEVLASSHLENWRYYPFSEFMGIVSDVSDPAYETELNGWVEQDKINPIPWIVRAQFFYDMGWFRRGHILLQKRHRVEWPHFQIIWRKASLMPRLLHD